MPDARHAILMSPNAQGWAWELIDADGATTAMGVAERQESAMASAWSAARSSSAGFPDFVFGYGAERRSVQP